MAFNNMNPQALSTRPVILAGLLVLVLSACGDEPAPPKSAAKAPAPPPTVTPADAQAGVPKPAGATHASADRSLATRVKDALLAEKALNAHGIEVDAKDGTVTLFGTVANKASRERAAQIAAGIEGARSVENKLVVVAGS